MKLSYLCLSVLFVFTGYVYGETKMINGQGLKIDSNYQPHKNPNSLFVQGELSTFVSCGSQYATWRQFPGAVQYKVIDLESNKVYASIGMMLSISESDNEIFDRYAKEPCNQIVSKDFSVNLNEVYFQGAPNNEIVNFELQAEYMGHKSNVLKLVNTPFQMKSF